MPGYKLDDTALDDLASVVDEVGSESICVVVHELLEAEAVEKTSAEAQVRGNAQHDQTQWEVDIEAARDDQNHIHVAHHLHAQSICISTYSYSSRNQSIPGNNLPNDFYPSELCFSDVLLPFAAQYVCITVHHPEEVDAH